MKKSLSIMTSVFLLVTVLFLPYSVMAEDPTASPSPSPEVSPSPSPSPSASPVVTTSSDCYLSALSVTGYDLNETFSKSVTKYTLTVPSTVTKIVVKATTNDSNATISSGTGTITLNETGDTIAYVKVKAEDGTTTKTYSITVSKKEINVNLKSLKIQGQALKETFSADVTSYTVEVPYEIETVTVVAAASDTTATVTTKGGSALVVGDNKITVTVKDTSGNTKVYTITVTRNEEEKDYIATSNSTSTKTSTSTVTATDDNTTTDSNMKYILVVIGSVILLTIGVLGIVFFIKTSDPEKKQKKLEKKRLKLIQKANELNKDESPLVEVAPTNNEEETDTKTEETDINDSDTLEFEKREVSSSRMGRYQENKDVLSDMGDVFKDE